MYLSIPSVKGRLHLGILIHRGCISVFLYILAVVKLPDYDQKRPKHVVDDSRMHNVIKVVFALTINSGV
jgi:hypothetical protein